MSDRPKQTTRRCSPCGAVAGRVRSLKPPFAWIRSRRCEGTALDARALPRSDSSTAREAPMSAFVTGVLNSAGGPERQLRSEGNHSPTRPASASDTSRAGRREIPCAAAVPAASTALREQSRDPALRGLRPGLGDEDVLAIMLGASAVVSTPLLCPTMLPSGARSAANHAGDSGSRGAQRSTIDPGSVSAST
jgi:hypothetical protein